MGLALSWARPQSLPQECRLCTLAVLHPGVPCVEVEEVVGVLTPFGSGVAQVFHVLLVELRLLLVAEVEEGNRQEEG